MLLGSGFEVSKAHAWPSLSQLIDQGLTLSYFSSTTPVYAMLSVMMITVLASETVKNPPN